MGMRQMLVPLMPEIRQLYQDKQDQADKISEANRTRKSKTLLRTLQSNAVEYFLDLRLEQAKTKQPIRYLVAPKKASLVNVFLPEKVHDRAAAAAEADGVSLRQLVHTALVLSADNLQVLRG